MGLVKIGLLRKTFRTAGSTPYSRRASHDVHDRWSASSTGSPTATDRTLNATLRILLVTLRDGDQEGPTASSQLPPHVTVDP